MRKFKSHKTVEAEHIAVIHSGRVTLDDGTDVSVPSNFFSRGEARPGDYLVRYSDGYLSWSPKKAFEDGYTEIEPDE